MKTIALGALLLLAVLPLPAAERFTTTLGTVHREIKADRAALTLKVTANDQTAEGSAAKLERTIAELRAQVAALNYPTTALTLKSRTIQRGREYSEVQKKWVTTGYDAHVTFGVILNRLENYDRFMTFLGLHEEYQILWQAMSSSEEGEARKQVITEALKAARAKAQLLATEGGARLGKLVEVTEVEDESREYGGATWGGNSRDPFEGTGAYPIGIFVRVRAKFELVTK